MKFYFAFFTFILVSGFAFSQTKNNISVVYGISDADVDIHGAIGDYGYDSQGGMNFGLTYTHSFNKVVAIETGLLFYNDKIKENSIYGGIGEVFHYGRVKLVSVPLNAKFTFLKYFYGTAGIAADFQTNYTNDAAVDKQSGIGLEFGIGGKYTVGQVTFFVNPYLRQYASTRFSNNLSEAGLRFGAGFNF